MKARVIETLTGGAVLALAGGFLWYGLAAAGWKQAAKDGYALTAAFDQADGIKPGTEVKVAGVKVGSVTAMELNKETYQAKLTLNLAADVKLPKDTAAAIRSEGLLGDRYIALEPGGDDAMLPEGGLITATQSSPGLEQLLGQAIYSMKGPDAATQAPAAPGIPASGSQAPVLQAPGLEAPGLEAP